MDWKLAMKEERAALKRIVALLFALADLAESASNRSALVRGFVIWILRKAETVARDYVNGAEAPPASTSVAPVGDGPADAMRLAGSFRDLADELECQARMAFAVHDKAGQARGVLFGARRARDMNDFLNALRRLTFAPPARPAASATGPPRDGQVPGTVYFFPLGSCTASRLVLAERK